MDQTVEVLRFTTAAALLRAATCSAGHSAADRLEDELADAVPDGGVEAGRYLVVGSEWYAGSDVRALEQVEHTWHEDLAEALDVAGDWAFVFCLPDYFREVFVLDVDAGKRLSLNEVRRFEVAEAEGAPCSPAT